MDKAKRFLKRPAGRLWLAAGGMALLVCAVYAACGFWPFGPNSVMTAQQRPMSANTSHGAPAQAFSLDTTLPPDSVVSRYWVPAGRSKSLRSFKSPSSHSM